LEKPVEILIVFVIHAIATHVGKGHGYNSLNPKSGKRKTRKQGGHFQVNPSYNPL